LVLKRNTHEFYERFRSVLHCIRALAGEAYAELGLGTAQAKILRHIGANSHISQADLARATDTAPTLTGRVLESLIDKGWVRRKRSSEDRRQYALELTASGKRMRDRVETARNGVIQRLSRVLDDKDAENFEVIAAKILGAFGTSRSGDPPAPR
jgi:DNA-binding MarR family transcriptional regulator